MNGNDLINTTVLPAGLREARILARKAKAYHALRPYPFVSFQQWKEEDRGPLPVCRPFVRHIVQKGADWLFLKPVNFKVPDDAEMSESINEVWSSACMGSRAVGMAVTGALSGAVDLKWSKPKEDTGEITIEIYDPTEHTRFYFDQTDPTKLLMARIQVPYFDYTQKKWFWKREDWTDEKWVTYEPLPCNPGASQNGYNPYQFVDEADKSEFNGKKESPNPFQIVPFQRVRNADSGDEWGFGDLWPYYQVVDQINFNQDLGHKDNQKRVNPATALIDLEQASNEAPDFGNNPDAVHVLESTEGKEGRIEVIEGSVEIREHIRDFADSLKKELYGAVGSVDFTPEEVTNKGSMTAAVLNQLYSPLIETTTRKRGLYGEDGLSMFFEKMSVGLSNIKLEGWKPVGDVQTIWPNAIEMTEEEKMAASQRQAFNIENAFTTHERAVNELAVQDGIIDVDELLEETKPLAEKKEQQADESHQATVAPQKEA